LLEALVEDVGRNGLAEGHGVALQDAAAARAARRQLGEVDRLAGIARHALDAADHGRIAVDLEQPLAPRRAVQVVDVLLDRALEGIELPRFHRAAPGLSRRPPSVSTRTGSRAVRRAASVDRRAASVDPPRGRS